MIHTVNSDTGWNKEFLLCDECGTTFGVGNDYFHSQYHDSPWWSRTMEDILKKIASGDWVIPTWGHDDQLAFTITELY